MSDDEYITCQGCGFEGAELKVYKTQRLDRTAPDKRLCMLCASTMVGDSIDYPEFYPNAEIMKCICFVGNKILAALMDK